MKKAILSELKYDSEYVKREYDKGELLLLSKDESDYYHVTAVTQVVYVARSFNVDELLKEWRSRPSKKYVDFTQWIMNEGYCESANYRELNEGSVHGYRTILGYKDDE